MSTSPKKSKREPKLIIDPNQTSFGFDLPEASVTTPQIVAPAAKETKPSINKGAAVAAARRAGPLRARISFEAPARLKRKLERVARELDRSKTALLRDAVEGYLQSATQKESEQ